MPKINFLVRGIICFLFIFVPLSSMDQWFYDRFFRLRGVNKRTSPFLLVRVNDSRLPTLPPRVAAVPREESLLRARSYATWHSDLYNHLLSRIQADKPRLVVFTSFYEWIDRNEQPQLNQENLLFSGLINEENKLVPPSPRLVSGDNYGFTNIFPDPDNLVRKSYLVYSSGSSLALRTYHRLDPAPIKRNLLDPLWIDFRGPGGTFRTYDGTDIMEDIVPPGTFKDKIVLVGRAESPALYYETPFGRMSRLEIQANTIDTFVNRREIRILPRYVTLITASVAVVLSIIIILMFPLTLAWLFLLLLSLLVILVCLFVFSQFKMWAGIANPLLCIFGTHLLMLGYKLSRQEEQQWKLQQESEYLREMDQFKNNFISLFSHDLKTPIAKIKAVTDRLLADGSSIAEDAKESLRSVDRSSSELARLISDILKVTKMESMSMEPLKEVIDLNRLVELAVQRLKPLADEKNIRIVMDLEPLFSMEGDEKLLQEVITNLLENAIKYSDAGKTVIIRTTEDDGRVRVAVVDEGVGIPADELPRVTGKFYRGKATVDSTKGSGLGLYLAKYFIELHDGALEIRSELGRGTEVAFSLPIMT